MSFRTRWVVRGKRRSLLLKPKSRWQKRWKQDGFERWQRSGSGSRAVWGNLYGRWRLVHASNPTARGTVSNIQPVCKGSVYGFGVYGYYLALEAVKQMNGAR